MCTLFIKLVVNPPPVKPGTSANYNSLTRPFLQGTLHNLQILCIIYIDDNDVDYHHLDHKKSKKELSNYIAHLTIRDGTIQGTGVSMHHAKNITIDHCFLED